MRKYLQKSLSLRFVGNHSSQISEVIRLPPSTVAMTTGADRADSVLMNVSKADV